MCENEDIPRVGLYMRLRHRYRLRIESCRTLCYINGGLFSWGKLPFELQRPIQVPGNII